MAQNMSTAAKLSSAVALGGFMGVGKTTVGRLLAVELGLPFVDLDALLVERHGPIARQILDEGEAIFRDRERRAIEDLVDGTDRVLATGGGAWVDPQNRVTLRRGYRLVVLDAPLAVLRARLDATELAGRPLWDGAEERRRARQPAYDDADLKLDATRAPALVVAEVVAWLKR